MQQDSFIEVLETHRGILYKIASSYTQTREDQQDLIQEISLQIYRSFHKFDHRVKWSTFIYRIALNVAISFYRKSKTRRHHSLSESIMQIPAMEKNNQGYSEEIKLLYQALDELKPLDKALMLLYLDESSTAQMAEILGISQTNVTSKINRIKKILKRKLEQKNRTKWN